MKIVSRDRLRKRLRAALKEHRMESEKLQSAGSVAASRWEDGYIAALWWVMDRLDRMKSE
jgi:hypothetical protein